MVAEDNDLKHTSKIVKRYRKLKKIKRIEWSVNSPNLNQIDNVWHILKSRVRKYRASNVNQLKVSIRKEWSKLSQNVGNNSNQIRENTKH